MGVSTRIESIDRDIELILAEDLSPAAVSKAIADTARVAIAEADEINARALGAPAPKRVFVDGRENAAFETVQPAGSIVAEFDLLEDVLGWIGEQLVLNSPVLTGQYARSHLIFAGGRELMPTDPIPAEFDEIVFINAQPYSRKIERGLSDQAPDGVYQGVAALAAARFGNLVSVKFSYRAFSDGAISAYVPVPRATGRNKKGRFTSSGRDRTAQKREQSLRRPAIIVTKR